MFAAGALQLAGYRVYRALAPDDTVDLVIDNGRRRLRAQVKTAHLTRRGKVRCHTRNHLYRRDSFDTLVVVYRGSIVLVPWCRVFHRKTIEIPQSELRRAL